MRTSGAVRLVVVRSPGFRSPMRSRSSTRAASGGGRGPDSFLLNMRFGYRIKMAGNRMLQVHFDVFNLTNRPNFANPTNVAVPFTAADRRLQPSFLVLQQVANGGPTRTAQFNVKYTF
jgi:hypothetical protein